MAVSLQQHVREGLIAVINAFNNLLSSLEVQSGTVTTNSNVVSGAFTLRKSGNVAQLTLSNVKISANMTSAHQQLTIGVLPTGFIPAGANYYGGLRTGIGLNVSTNGNIILQNGNDSNHNYIKTSDGIYGSITYICN